MLYRPFSSLRKQMEKDGTCGHFMAISPRSKRPQLVAFLLNLVAQMQQQPRDQLPLWCPMEDQTMTSALLGRINELVIQGILTGIIGKYQETLLSSVFFSTCSTQI
jgi:hypothetical protein